MSPLIQFPSFRVQKIWLHYLVPIIKSQHDENNMMIQSLITFVALFATASEAFAPAVRHGSFVGKSVQHARYVVCSMMCMCM